MKIATSGRLVTITPLGTIVLIIIMISMARSDVDAADAERRLAGEITRAISELRLVSFEYMLHRPERARLQELRAAATLERLLLGQSTSTQPELRELMTRLRQRSDASHRLFTELLSTRDWDAGHDGIVQQRFQAQLTNRLLLELQESAADAFRLVELSGSRIDAAQQRLTRVIAAGLALVALTIGCASWLIHRKVLGPLRRIEAGTREVAAGNLGFRLNMVTQDEIGEMARNFDAMTDALRESFAQIERSNQELAALNKEIEAFSYSVSHDLRAPLRSMDGFSLALIEDYADRLDDEGRGHLVRIRNASQRMGRLIDDLLGLARVTRRELVLRAVDMSALVREIAESLQQRQPERAMAWEIEDGLVVQADRALLHIALQNLLENAWKFTARVAAPVIRVGAAEQDGRRTYFVSDNGVGFDLNYADRLFGAFQRLHHESEFPGTGIGLAIVQRIFHRHDVAVWAHSEPGRGATFYFTLRESHERSEQGHPAG